MKYTLDGKWKLGFTHPDNGRFIEMPATVPGNVEIELMKNGYIDDIYPADDYRATTKFDTVDDWTYTFVFDSPEFTENSTQELVFDGIDTIADIYLNDEKIYEARDMFITHRIDINGKLKSKDNALKVVIRSAILYARQFETEEFAVPRAHTLLGGQAYLRKARHEWGWDNAPRLLTSGIFRSVYIESLPNDRFSDVYLYTRKVREDSVDLGINWNYITEEKELRDLSIRYTLYCNGETAYCDTREVDYVRGMYPFTVSRDKISLWWPRGLGAHDMCDIKLEMLKNGEVCAVWTSKWGIRTLRLERTEDILDDGSGEFVFVVNNEKVYINGTNWKPLDALHSRANEKVERAIELACDLNCNMIRVWGGGIYEDDTFFDACDRNGIMVWQDFMFACEFPPCDDWYCKQIEQETKIIIKKLRNHPSLAVWCGDNEDDECLTWLHGESTILPSDNRITREVLKKCVLHFDPYRSYVESSPYASDANINDRRAGKITHHQPESHLYPATGIFDEALRNCKGRFIGETGPIAVNAMTDSESIHAREEKRMVRLWNDEISRNDYCNDMHQGDKYFRSWRSEGRSLCLEWFKRDFSPDEWKDYCLAINIICGDVFKEVIEYCRVNRWSKTGVIWWSLYDMWPMMFNYSVVDVDFNKKMPYYWIRQSQQFFDLMIVRQELNGEIMLYTANDTLESHRGEYKITAFDMDGVERHIASGMYDAKPNSARMIQLLPENDRPELWIITWNENGITSYNHFVTCGKYAPFEAWKEWSQRLMELYGDR